MQSIWEAGRSYVIVMKHKFRANKERDWKPTKVKSRGRVGEDPEGPRSPW